MTTLLPKDADNNTIPALRLKADSAHIVNASASSARNSTAFDEDTKVVSVYATGPVYIRFGDGSVTATTGDHYFPAGVYYDIAIGGGSGKGAQHTHMAVLRVDADCSVYVSEKE